MVSFVHPGRVYPPKHVLVLGNTRHSLLRSCSVLYHTLHNLQVARVISFHLLTYGTDTCGTTSVTLFFLYLKLGKSSASSTVGLRTPSCRWCAVFHSDLTELGKIRWLWLRVIVASCVKVRLLHRLLISCEVLDPAGTVALKLF